MRKYKHNPITTIEFLLVMIERWKRIGRPTLFFDTETTGLHIINDTPFFLQFGWVDPDGTLEILTADLDDCGLALFKRIARAMIKMATSGGTLVGHNIKFDLHMLQNLGIEIPDSIRYVDTMILIRAAHDALIVANGGPPLGLKEYCARYVNRGAKDHERLIAMERTSIAKGYNLALKNKLKWTLKAVDDFFKDCLNDMSTMSPEGAKVYAEWLETIPEVVRNNMTGGRVESNHIPYTMLNRKQLTKYAVMDIVLTEAVYTQCNRAIVARDTSNTVEAEEKLIPALVRMERCGFEINVDYVLESKETLRNYIREQRTKLYECAGEEISVGQHKRIKDILLDKYNLAVKGTGDADLQDVISNLKQAGDNNEALKFITLVQEMRTLEKWYSTYLQRFLRELEHNNRVYTQINQVGTVAGRVTSDFQQFPRGDIKKEDGTHLFNPRRMVKISPGMKGIAYLDYSQIELRGQAMYTILVGEPDLNLCRAYMPYKCFYQTLDKNRIDFNYNNPKHIKHAYDKKWYHKEDGNLWHPIDVHEATAKEIIPELTKEHPEYKKWRSVGKTTNFAKNYGAKYGRIRQMFPDFDEETIHKIDNAYYKAFPGVKAYHQYCYNMAMENAYVSNLFGIKYYGLTGHKLINALVQGSCAYFLKDRIYEIDKYIQRHNLKTRLQMQIHDELSYEIAPGEKHHIAEFQKIMQNWEGSLVPIVADLEFTTTTWADKEEVDTVA